MSYVEATAETFLLYWHIVSGQIVLVETRTQYPIHDTLDLEGSIVLNGTAQLILRD